MTTQQLPNRSAVQAYCDRLAGEGGQMNFRVFYPKEHPSGGTPENIPATTLDKVFHRLTQHNNAGASICIMVNETDGDGYTSANVNRVRAVFADLDGAPLQPVLGAGIKAHLIIETSPGRYHVIWKVADCPLDQFKPVQQAIAQRFDADPSVCDPPRVLRVPGFWHLKGEPFQSRIEHQNPDLPPYRLEELVTGLGLELGDKGSTRARRRPGARYSLTKGVGEGERATAAASLAGGLINDGLDDDAALAQLRTWNALNRPPMDEDELSGTLQSVRRTHARNQAANDSVVEEFNQRHAVTQLGGKTRVIFEQDDGDVVFQAYSDFRQLYSNRPDVGDTPAAAYWLRSPGRRSYLKGVIFDPSREAANDGYYNLWKGFAVEPREGDCSLFLQHVLEVIAAGDRRLFEYLLDWMADAVQNPGQLPGVALVLKGSQGVGKGVFANYFGRLYGRHFLQVSQPDHLTGHFNAHQANKLLIFADEVVWGGGKKVEGALKSLITEPTYMMEAKGSNPVQVDNCRRVIMASNEQWAVPAGMEERRFVVLDVSNARARDWGYFDNLTREQERGGPEALLHLLLNRDLTNVNIRKFPRTAALLDQKIRSLPSVANWWYGCLSEGQIVLQPTHEFAPPACEHPWPDWAETEKLYRYYLSATSGDRHGRGKPRDKGGFIKELRKIAELEKRRAPVPEVSPPELGAPSDLDASFPTFLKVDASPPPRTWGYAIPPLDACRASFEKLLGQPIPWDE